MNYVFPRAHPDVVPMGLSAGRFGSLSADKLRGGYYTPAHVSEWLCRWAVRTKSDFVLEPSAGDGSFAAAAAKRLRLLGATMTTASRQMAIIELIEAEAAATRARLAPWLGVRAGAAVVAGDFFGWLDKDIASRRFDAVVGNPPFIRYQSFPEPARSLAMARMVAAGFKPNRLTNAWVPFVVAGAESLREGGRIAMVIPAELLQVSYAAQLRAYLTDRFKHVDIVTCNELFFKGAEQEVVLLLADGALPARIPGNRCRVAVVERATVAEVVEKEPAEVLAGSEEKDVRGGLHEKWLKYLLTNREIGLLRALKTHPGVTNFSALGEVDVGIVTGSNEFFVVRRDDASKRRIIQWTHRLASRSAHLRGAVLSEEDWCALDQANQRVRLLNLHVGANGALDERAAAYVADGEAKDLHLGFKCSIRSPWWRVPSLWNPDAFLLRQIHDFPRFVLNTAGATATDTIHRVRSRFLAGC